MSKNLEVKKQVVAEIVESGIYEEWTESYKEYAKTLGLQ